MLTGCGMSESLGPGALEESRQALFLRVPSDGRKEYGEETSRMIDAEVRKMLGASQKRGHDTLTEKRNALESLAKLLMEKEVADRKEPAQVLAEPSTI
jgi:cell division protease FtsH